MLHLFVGESSSSLFSKSIHTLLLIGLIQMCLVDNVLDEIASVYLQCQREIGREHVPNANQR